MASKASCAALLGRPISNPTHLWGCVTKPQPRRAQYEQLTDPGLLFQVRTCPCPCMAWDKHQPCQAEVGIAAEPGRACGATDAGGSALQASSCAMKMLPMSGHVLPADPPTMKAVQVTACTNISTSQWQRWLLQRAASLRFRSQEPSSGNTPRVKAEARVEDLLEA